MVARVPDKRSEHKLSASQQLALCSLLATGYNSVRCSDIFKEEYGISFSPQNIYQNYIKHPKWKKIIKYMAERAQRRVLAHPLAKKINRLNILQDAINEAFTWRLDKIHYDHDGNELSRVEKRNIGMVAQLVSSAREEVEGKNPVIVEDNRKQIFQFFNPEGKSVSEIMTDINSRLSNQFKSR